MQIGSPGIPKDRLDYLRETAKRMAQTPEFISDLSGVLGYTPASEAFVTGEKIQELAELTSDRTSEIRSAFAELVKMYLK